MNRRQILILSGIMLGCAGALSAQQPVFSGKNEVESVKTEAGNISVKKVVEGLNHPWGMAFLTDGRLLVTERSGNLRILNRDGNLSDPVQGVPEVFAEGQGGLLDVALHPDFKSNNWVYLSYAEPGEGGASTALGRGRLQNGRLRDFEVIFRQEPKVPGPNHFGGRIVFHKDGSLFLSLGERFKFDPAQDPSNHLGAVVRVMPDGSTPRDNPFVNDRSAAKEIWSYGHRNILSAGVHPQTGDLWVVEMGPLGGDELNRPEKGRNYGWPEVSWGSHYDGRSIPNPNTRSEFEDAVRHYSPVISPSGMTWYDSNVFPEWRNSFFVGGLSSRQLVRLQIEGQDVAHEERIPLGERIRDVEQGPDGYLYVATDQENGAIWRIEPLNPNQKRQQKSETPELGAALKASFR